MLGTLFSRSAIFGAAMGALKLGANRRRERREPVQGGTIEIGGKRYPVQNWSASGFLATSCKLRHLVDDRVPIAFSMLLPDGRLEFRCEAVLVRVDRKKQEVAGVFVKMDTDTRVAIAQYFD